MHRHKGIFACEVNLRFKCFSLVKWPINNNSILVITFKPFI